MSAMENATKAANDMLTNSLTLQFNKARQASITMELMDIIGGVEARKDNMNGKCPSSNHSNFKFYIGILTLNFEFK